MFARGPQRFAAGGQDPNAGTAVKQRVGNDRGLRDDVLAVVEDQQRRPVLEVRKQSLEQRAIGHVLDA